MDIDLNLIRLFDAIYRLKSVSQAAQALDLSQPAASQGLSRLRGALNDALFVRTSGGMRPTPRAERLATTLCPAIQSIESVLLAGDVFTPLVSDTTFNVHMSDIGEARLLPGLTHALSAVAPHVKLHSMTLGQHEIGDALASGKLQFAFGYLPGLMGAESRDLIDDEYCVVMHRSHSVAKVLDTEPDIEDLRQLDFAVVMSHSETFRIIRQLGLEKQIKLRCQHFLSLPGIVSQSQMSVIMPLAIARTLMPAPDFRILDLPLPGRGFTVSIHWDKRFEDDPGNRWFRALCLSLFNSDTEARSRQSD